MIEKKQPRFNQNEGLVTNEGLQKKNTWYSRIRKHREGNTVGKRLERTSVEKGMNLSKWVTDDGKESKTWY